jgi:hypothetical protein
MYSFNVLALFVGCRCKKGKAIPLQALRVQGGLGSQIS